jgi:Ca-activated chloride channel family protein
MNDVTFMLSAAFDRQLFWRGGGSVRYLVAKLNAARTDHTGKIERARLNIALVIDASGSMDGGKLEAAKAAALGLAERLTPRDHLTVVSFASDIVVHLDAVAVTPAALDRIRAEISNLRTRGQTNLSGGWFAGVECAARVAQERPDMTPRVILLSDGRTNDGITDPSELFEHADELRLRGVLTSTLGIGDGYDEHLLRGMAEHGGGRLHDAELVDEISSVLHGELDDILLTVIENTKLTVFGPENVTIEVLGTKTFQSEAGLAVVSLGAVQYQIERVVVFKVTCPETDVPSDELGFSVMAEGRSVGDQGSLIAAGPALLSLTAASGGANAGQSRDDMLAGTVARMWSAHIVAEAATLNRERAYREAEAHVEHQLRYFRRYVEGLDGAEALCRDLESLVRRIGRRVSSRSSKEMYLQSRQTTESRMDRRGAKPSWSERLDSDS